MATVEMPQLGESVTEGTILAWFKEPGDPVALDEPLCEIETEKVNAELPSPFAGTMGEILAPQGDTVEVGAPLCTIVSASEAPAPSPASQPGAPSPPEEAQTPPAAGVPAPAPAEWSGGPMAVPPEETAPPAAAAPARAAPAATAGRFYSPAVLRLAAEHDVDLDAISGTGRGGRVTRRDVERAIERRPAAGATAEPEQATPIQPPAPTAGDYEVVALSPTRRTIAERMTQSIREAPQAWTMVEADVTDLVARREREKAAAAEAGVELTLLPYFTAAVVETLRAFPAINARWEGDELRRYQRVHIGIAVATEHGLVVPVVHNAGELSVDGLARRISDLSERARARKLRVEDVEGGTFTVNNTGAFGSIASKPIVNYPQVAIVTMERVTRRPVVIDEDAIAVRSMLNVCLSFDHRALDGHEVGEFLAALKERLESADV